MNRWRTEILECQVFCTSQALARNRTSEIFPSRRTCPILFLCKSQLSHGLDDRVLFSSFKESLCPYSQSSKESPVLSVAARHAIPLWGSMRYDAAAPEPARLSALILRGSGSKW